MHSYSWPSISILIKLGLKLKSSSFFNLIISDLKLIFFNKFLTFKLLFNLEITETLSIPAKEDNEYFLK